MTKDKKIPNQSKPKELVEKAKKHLIDLTGFKSPAGIGLRKENQEWIATIEILEKKSIPDGMDVLGIYEVRLDNGGDLIEYERKRSRRRMDTEASKE